MDTCCCPPGDRDPLDGLKVAPTSLLADQFIFPVELASSVKVTVQGDVTPQVLESKLVGLTDQFRIGVGVGLGDGPGEGDGPGDGCAVGEGEGVAVAGVVGVGVGVVAVTASRTRRVAFPPFECICTVAA